MRADKGAGAIQWGRRRAQIGYHGAGSARLAERKKTKGPDHVLLACRPAEREGGGWRVGGQGCDDMTLLLMAMQNASPAPTRDVQPPQANRRIQQDSACIRRRQIVGDQPLEPDATVWCKATTRLAACGLNAGAGMQRSGQRGWVAINGEASLACGGRRRGGKYHSVIGKTTWEKKNDTRELDASGVATLGSADLQCEKDLDSLNGKTGSERSSGYCEIGTAKICLVLS